MRGQITLEYLIVMTLAVLFLVILLVVGSHQLSVAVDQRTSNTLEDITLTIQRELLTAQNVHDGYTRTFSLPSTINNKPYTITSGQERTATVFTIASGNKQLSVSTPLCNGSINPGINTITKAQGIIRCNS